MIEDYYYNIIVINQIANIVEGGFSHLWKPKLNPCTHVEENGHPNTSKVRL